MLNLSFLIPDFGEEKFKWLGLAEAFDGRIYGCPSDAKQVLCVNPATDTAESLGPVFDLHFKWVGSTRALDGNVYGIPDNSSRILKISPREGSVELWGPNLGDTPGKCSCGVLAPNGNIYCPPSCSSRVLRINPAEGVAELIGPTFEGDWKWGSGASAPQVHSHVLCIDTATDAVDLFGPDLGPRDLAKWTAAIFADDGKIYCPPACDQKVLCIDPATGTTERFGQKLGSFRRIEKWRCGALFKDGNIYCPPAADSRILSINPRTRSVTRIGPDLGSSPHLFEASNKWQSITCIGGTKAYCVPCLARRILCMAIAAPAEEHAEANIAELREASAELREANAELRERSTELSEQQEEVQRELGEQKKEVQRLTLSLAEAEERRILQARPSMLTTCTQQQLEDLHDALKRQLDDTCNVLEQVVAQKAVLRASEDARCCRICQERIVNCVITPCGHIGCCSICAHGCLDRGCPFCRQPVQSIQIIFQC